MTALASVSPDVLRAADLDYPAYIFPWFDTVQTLLRNGPDLDAKRATTVEQVTSDANTPDELITRLIYPPIELLHYVLNRDAGGFNTALERALKLDKQYWSPISAR